MKDKVKWCFNINAGLKLIKPNKNLSESYLKMAKDTIKLIDDISSSKNILWITVMCYYSSYYCVESFLSLIGVKSENHTCSILLTKYLLGEEKTKIIEQEKRKRIDAQYYNKFVSSGELSSMNNDSKNFLISFEYLINNLDEEKIKEYKDKIKALL